MTTGAMIKEKGGASQPEDAVSSYGHAADAQIYNGVNVLLG